MLLLAFVAACGFDTTIPQTSAPPDSPAVITVDAMPDAPPAALCTTRYSTAAGFDLCTATPTACRFYAQTNGTCDALCRNLGGTCTESYDGDCEDTSTTIHDCMFSLGDQVCNCRP